MVFVPLSFAPLGETSRKKNEKRLENHMLHGILPFNPLLPPPMTISPRVTIRTQAKRAMVAVAVCQRRRSPQNFRTARIFLAKHGKVGRTLFFRGNRVTSDFCSLVLVGNLLRNRVWKSLIFQIRPPPTGHHHLPKMCAFNHPKNTGKILEIIYIYIYVNLHCCN